jgi:hypothetical protein
MANLGIGDGLYLLHKQITAEAPAPVAVEVPSDHVIIIDCSGSMYHELPNIRHQLKNKVATMLREHDTLSIIWFSGKTQFGVVVEAVALRTAVDLSGIHRAIDNYLRPIGLTGFVEPLKEAQKLIKRVQKAGRAINLFFMSDGYDNQWSREQILTEAHLLQEMVSSAAVVEYGWYCNKPLMVAMAERLGATEVLAENFSQYEPIFESALTKKVLGAKKTEARLDTRPLHGFCFSLDGGEVVSYAVDGHSVLVPEGVRDLYYFAELPTSANFSFPSEVMEQKTRNSEAFQAALYAGMVPLTQRMLSGEIFSILKVLGDVKLIRQFANCFGKQAYLGFQNAVTDAAFNKASRHVEGYNPNEVPADDAYTLLDLLFELQSDSGNLFYPNHEAFEYQRTGRKSVSADAVLTEDEQNRVNDIAVALGAAKDPKVLMELQKELSAIVDSKPKALKFTPSDPDAGYSVSNLVLNEDRPNVSAQVHMEGTVDLTDRLAGSDWPKDGVDIPKSFPTKIVRNYTIIRDGIRNVSVLPVSLTESTHRALTEAGVMTDGYHKDIVYEIDLTKIPLINRKMVKSVSAKALFEKSYDLLKLQAAQKVFNDFHKKNFPSLATKGITEAYGPDAAAWLAELGIKDYGFSPKTVLAEATESYYGKELAVAIAGLASLPTVKAVEDKMADPKKKLTAREQLLVPAIKEVQDAAKTHKEARLESWVTGHKVSTIRNVRQMLREIAEIKFSIIVGQVWFKEFTSLDENTMTLKIDGQDIGFTANLNEIEIKV